MAVRQLVYISTVRDPRGLDFAAIEHGSQRRNAQDGLSGLLLFDGHRFLQVLEGPADGVDRAMARIRGDARHWALVVLSDRTVPVPAFGRWAMLCRDARSAGRALPQLIAAHLGDADASLRATLTGFAQVAEARAAA